MAAFQCIPNLIIFNVFILPGLALPSSPPATPFNSSPNTQRYKVASQKQTEFPSKLESDLIVVVFGQHSGKAWTGTLELDGETGEDHPGDSNSVLNIEQVSPGDGEIRRTELEKVKKDWGSFKPWGKRAQSEAENRNFGRDQRFDREAWRNNIDKYWIKRSEDDSEGTSDNIKPNTGIKSNWEDKNMMNVWEKRRVYWDAVPNSDNYSNKENNASNGKREWTPDNLPRVYGKRNRETGEDHPGDSNRVLNIEQVSPGDGEIRRTELEKVKKDWGSFKPWGKRAQSEAENRNFGRDQRFDREAWRNNIDKYWIKRSEDDSEGTSDNIKPNTGIKSTWEDKNMMNVWEKRRVYWDAVPNSDNYSDKENNASNGKREWTPDNLPRVYGKRNSQPVPNWDDYSDKEKNALKGKREWTPDNLPRVYGKRNIQPVA